MDKQEQKIGESNLNTDDFIDQKGENSKNKSSGEKNLKSSFGGIMSKFSGVKNKTPNNDNDISINRENENQSDNIFSQLSGDLDFGDDDDFNIEEKSKKDIYFYLKIFTGYIFLFNLILGIIVFLSISYVHIQNDKAFGNKAFLDPVCDFILGDGIENTKVGCSSVSFLLNDYENKSNELESNIAKKLSSLIEDVYTIENFIYSREISFLLNSANNRLRPMDILNQFDKLKNDFSPNDKGVIRCENIDMNSDNTVSFNCSAYSSSWEISSGGFVLVGESGNRGGDDVLEGTSQSIAASFLNFIEKNPEYNFRLLEKQKIFDSESVVGEGTFVRKTDFSFTVRYNVFGINLSL